MYLFDSFKICIIVQKRNLFINLSPLIKYLVYAQMSTFFITNEQEGCMESAVTKDFTFEYYWVFIT